EYGVFKFSEYQNIVNNWLSHGSDSLPASTPIDRLEHRLLKLFFFDVINTLSESKGTLRAKADYVVYTLLRLSHSGEPYDRGQVAKDTQFGSGESSPSLGNSQPVLKLNHEPRRLIPEPGTAVSVAPKHSPRLPPEVVERVLNHLEASQFSGVHRSRCDRQEKAKLHRDILATFHACALVNRSWHTAAAPALWRVVRLNNPLVSYRFLDGLYNNSLGREQTSEIRILPSQTSMTTLKLSCGEGQSLWQTVLRNLFLFPNLRHLTLDSLESPDDLSLLFDQDLPSLQHLSVWGTVQDGLSLWRPSGSWTYGSVDRKDALAFFSRLTSVKFSWCYSSVLPNVEDIYCPVVCDSAHPKLRRITIPENIRDRDVEVFFGNCSSALSVVCLFAQTLSTSTLVSFAMKCTGLRALCLREGVDLEGFKCLMERCGHQLVALQLGNGGADYFKDPQLVQFIANHCHSLEYLNLSFSTWSDDAPLIEDNLINLVQQCGSTLRYFSVYLDRPSNEDDECQYPAHYEYWQICTDTLTRTMANCCPLLRGFIFDIGDVPCRDSSSSLEE
ncbi:hypothetical protein HK102_004370, partial [Quaeritorhiza haematococci]